MLHEDLGTDILPAEYGGTNGTVQELTGESQQTEQVLEAGLLSGAFLLPGGFSSAALFRKWNN